MMLLDDGPGKAIGIDHYIGRVPIAAFGNSDGDLAMLETTTNSPTRSRERALRRVRLAHRRRARIRLRPRHARSAASNQGLDLAPKLGWHLIDMKSDWKVIFPFELEVDDRKPRARRATPATARRRRPGARRCSTGGC